MIRIPYLVTLLSTDNFLVATTPVAILGIVELGLGLLATSMVIWKPLFKRWFKGERPYNSGLKGSRYVRNTGGSESNESRNKKPRRQTDSEEALALSDLEVPGGASSRG